MKAEKFDYDKHHEMVSKWLEKHSFPLPPKDYLPSVGFVVNDTACGFLYISNSKLGWIEWVFADPLKSLEERQRALDTLFALLYLKAQEFEIEALFSSSSIPAYEAVLTRNGFKVTDKNVTHFVKLLKGD